MCQGAAASMGDAPCDGRDSQCASAARAGLPPQAGLGLKPQHFAELLTNRPPLGFVEVHAENYMVDGGPLHHYLGRVREFYPLSLHGVGLSLGGETPLDDAHMARLAALVKRYRPAAFSEHLAWSTHDGAFLNDLLPIAYDDAALRRVCRHVEIVQDRLGMRVLLENPATYVSFAHASMSEEQFITEVVERTGCGLLLDLTNVRVSCVNHGLDPCDYLGGLPLDAVDEIHLAGYAIDSDADGATLLIDDHGSAVDGHVWALYKDVIRQLGPKPTLIERDRDVPDLATLMVEARAADAVMVADGAHQRIASR